MVDNKLYEIIIAAWLHDIGKFIQRARLFNYRRKDLEGQYCKKNKLDFYGYQHVLYSYGFIEDNKDVFPDGINYSNVAKLAASHHNPSSAEEFIISEADCLSSSSDRRIDEDLEYHNNNKFFEQPMIHLLSTLNIPGKEKNKTGYVPLQALEDNAVLSNDNGTVSKEDYKILFEQFAKAFAQLKGLTILQFLESLDAVMERYCWCIPSSTINDPDVSLYDHSKTTAAFASAMYIYHEENNSLNEASVLNKKDKKYLLVNGDMSGIQKYLFDLKTTTDNAKILRARSYLLDEQTKAIANYIVENTTKTNTSILVSAAGRFIILLPNTKNTLKTLKDTREKVEDYFLNTYSGSLSFQLSVPIFLSFEELGQEKSKNIFDDLLLKTDEAKYKKLKTALFKNEHIPNNNYSLLQEREPCVQCGINPSEKDKVCNLCNMQVNIGTKLPKANYFIKNPKLVDSVGSIFGLSFGLEKNPLSKTETGITYSIHSYNPNYGLVHSPYYVPKDEYSNVLTFEDLEKKSGGGIKKLAMFKADIDNLGLLFSEFLKKRFSFSRYASLSRMLNYFFSTYLYSYITKNQKYSNIYIVFSGGDDICAIGPWDALISFAIDFQKELRKFTGNNNSISLSGGIAIMNSKVPVKTISFAVENQLEIAKIAVNKRTNKIEKNKISMVDTPLDWDEFEMQIEKGKKLASKKEKDKLSTSLIYNIIHYANEHEKVLAGDVSKLIWKSHFLYSASRNILNRDTNKEQSELFSWYTEFATEEAIIPARVAATYALYKTRKGED